MPTIEHNHRTITYRLERSDVSFIKIYLDDLNGIEVTTSESKEEERIKAFIRKKADWIEEKWKATHPALYTIDQLTLDSDQKISYLGRSYRLWVETSDEQAFSFQKGKFFFRYDKNLPEEEAMETLAVSLQQWLQKKAVEKFSTVTNRNVEMEQDQTRLGFKGDEIIHLNWRLVQLPKDKIQQTIQDLYEGKTC